MRTPAGRQPSVHRCVRRFHFHRTAAVIIARINDIERDVDSTRKLSRDRQSARFAGRGRGGGGIMRASLRRGTSITSIANYRELPSLSRVIVRVVAICGAQDTFASPITIESDHRSDSPLGFTLPSSSSFHARRGEASPSDAPPFLFLPLFLFPPPSAEPKEDSPGVD